MYIPFMYITLYSSQVLMKIEFSRRLFDKYSNIGFNGYPSSWSRVVPCGRTDRHDEANSHHHHHHHHHYVREGLDCFLFLNPRDEVGPSISS
jgi:hypothetical protein